MIRKLLCWFLGHKWTCDAEKGKKPTANQLKDFNGFADYAKMYCDRCGKESEFNRRIFR